MAPGIIREHPNAVRVGVIGTVVLAGLLFLVTHTKHQAAPPPPPTMTMVMIQPPKPPPPPPPLPQPKIVQPQKITVPTPKPLVPNQPPKPAPPRPSTPAAVPMGTSIHNNGPADAFNLGGNPGGNGFLGGGGGGGGGGGSYGDTVSYEISQALQKNAKTRNLSAGLQVRVAVDGNGTITSVTLLRTSGNAATDNIVIQVLPHLHLDPPPSGGPVSMNISLIAQSAL